MGMTLWWIGIAVLVLVVLPVVVLLLQRLSNAVGRIDTHVRKIHDQAGGLVVAVNDVAALVGTRDRVSRVGSGLTRYVNAVDRIL
ncbi:MAG TPA: hypothetical protein VGM60_23700 [Pseudonocardia sp.]|jgi:hypothetical protein|uniref:hypothetical protein n=1 Tax=Pseudonocardia sp. TaxID=60912 RepID=UPI002F404F0E